MATVTGLTADRMLAIEAASVVDGDVVGDNLILTKHDGSQINAGNVRGPTGPTGPVGQDLAVMSAVPVYDLGVINHIRCGRQLSPADFANLGLSAPLGLWNFANNLNDSSGNGRNLINKGNVPYGVGIMGSANNAAQFTGSVTQSLYILDTGAADPFRIRTGSVGCWIKCTKRATGQYVFAKVGAGGTNAVTCWAIFVSSSGSPAFTICDGTNAVTATPSSMCDVVNDRWHFVVATFDGTGAKLYVDGNLESTLWGSIIGNMNAAVPLNIGGYGADAGTNSAVPYFGRVDEAFVTSDVLSEEQVRNLYCAKIPHALGAVPSRATINIRRRRHNPALVVADFSQQPLRLYNFSAGSLVDEGSNATNLQNNGACPPVAGVDGVKDNAFHFTGSNNLSATDTGLPAALAPRTLGLWMKASMTGTGMFLAYGGTINSADTRIGMANGQLTFNNGTDGLVGPYVCDGLWHFVVGVEDNAAVDGVKRRLYLDGHLVASSTAMNGITLSGANRLRIGCAQDFTNPTVGQADSVFICGYAMSQEEIARLYTKGTQPLASSPKNAGDHIEGMTATDILAVFDSLDCTAQVDLMVAA